MTVAPRRRPRAATATNTRRGGMRSVVSATAAVVCLLVIVSVSTATVVAAAATVAVSESTRRTTTATGSTAAASRLQRCSTTVPTSHPIAARAPGGYRLAFVPSHTSSRLDGACLSLQGQWESATSSRSVPVTTTTMMRQKLMMHTIPTAFGQQLDAARHSNDRRCDMSCRYQTSRLFQSKIDVDGGNDRDMDPTTDATVLLASPSSGSPNGAGPKALPQPLVPKSGVQRVYNTWLWKTKSPNAQTSETYRINYRVEKGRRRTDKKRNHCILLVHGFGANLNHFRYQFPALLDEDGYNVYALDLLGFGASDKPQNAASVGFSMDLFIQLVTDFVEAMSVEEIHDADANDTNDETTIQSPVTWTLAGNSIGGLCCLGVVAALNQKLLASSNAALSRTSAPVKSPSRSFAIANIVLFNTSGGMTGFRYEDAPLWARPVLWLVQTVVLGPVIGKFFFANFKTRDNVESILTQAGVYRDTTNVDEELLDILLTPADDDGAEAVFLAVFGGPAGPTAESLLPYVTVPVLALWGQDDPWTPLDAGLHPGRALPPYHGTKDFRLEVISGAGHCPHDECPDVVNAKMLSFLREQQC